MPITTDDNSGELKRKGFEVHFNARSTSVLYKSGNSSLEPDRYKNISSACPQN